MVKISKFDAAEHLDSPEMIAAYLSEAFEDGDPEFITDALSTVARARGMAKLAAGATTFATIQELLGALGMKLVIKPQNGLG